MNNKMTFKPLLMAALWLISMSVMSAHASNVLEDISFASIPGDKIQIVLKFSEAAPEPGIFTIDSPARIAFDFPGTGVALSKKRQTIGIGLARSITAVAAGGRTRVVLNMVALTKYSTEIDGNNVVIVLNDANVAGKTSALGKNSISNIDFQLGSEGEGRIIISFTDKPSNVNIKQEFEKLVVDIENVSLPSNLERRLDVKDFSTPVLFIDTTSSGNNIKMVVDTNGEFDHLGYQAGRTFTIEVKGLTKAQKEAKEKAKFGYTGERLSLNFQDIEVRAVLQLIADFTGKNMVTSDTVNGSITLRLKNVPWDQALAIILKTKGLGMREEGNVMRVAPAEELAAIEKQELESKKQIADLLPLVTETIQLRYVPATTIEQILNDMANPESTKNQVTDTTGAEGDADSEGFSFISSRATFVADDRSNQLVIRDTARNISQLRKLIKELDTPVRQVLIDARVVSASDKFNREMGLNWNFRSTNGRGENKNPGQVTTGASNRGLTRDYETVDDQGKVTHFFPSDVPLGQGLLPAPVREPRFGAQTSAGQVDLGSAQKNILGITFGLLHSGYLVDLEISASQEEGTIELISSPRVVTANGKPAHIKQGAKIPYLEQNISGNTIKFIDAVLQLDVTPLVIPGKKVFMELKINKDRPDFNNTVLGVPTIDTKEVTTTVLVDNGDTIVLGGIFEQATGHGTDSVPVLGDIPVIGAAFRAKTSSEDKEELMIFITPKIMDDSISVR